MCERAFNHNHKLWKFVSDLLVTPKMLKDLYNDDELVEWHNGCKQPKTRKKPIDKES